MADLSRHRDIPFVPADFGARPGTTLPMTNRQEATVIAALRLWQAALRGKIDLVGVGAKAPDFGAIATDMGLHEPLTADEVDELLGDVFRVV